MQSIKEDGSLHVTISPSPLLGINYCWHSEEVRDSADSKVLNSLFAKPDNVGMPKNVKVAGKRCCPIHLLSCNRPGRLGSPSLGSHGLNYS